VTGAACATIGEALRAAALRLAPVSATARLDAELLMAHALGTGREALLLGRSDAPAPEGFEGLLARRLDHEPIAYIVGHKPFWSFDLAVSPAVLIPRPDSETLIEAAIAHFEGQRSGRAPRRILDLGTGSGALLLAALSEWPDAQGVGIDASPAALAVAEANARALGLDDRASFRIGDWQGDAQADLILCNPPYIAEDEALPPSVARFEPAAAFFAGKQGLDDYVRIAAVMAFVPSGVACVEIGATQAAAVSALFESHGFACAIRQDLAGHDRCIVVTR
jgi:release factor glutamine methyltransferase